MTPLISCVVMAPRFLQVATTGHCDERLREIELFDGQYPTGITELALNDDGDLTFSAYDGTHWTIPARHVLAYRVRP